VNQIEAEKHKIAVIQADSGKEFDNKHVKQYLQNELIDLRLVPEGNKTWMGVVERFNRTLRDMITKYLTHTNNVKWIDVLPDLVNNYNTSYHSSVGVPPVKVNEKKEREIIYDKLVVSSHVQEHKYKQGDSVRIQSKKGLFDKGGNNYSKEIYIIEKVNRFTVRLVGYPKLVKIEKLQKVDQPKRITRAKAVNQIEKADRLAKHRRLMARENL
jgi:hypothetical protein